MPRSASQRNNPVTISGAWSMPGFDMIPTVSMGRIEKKLPVAFSAQNGAWDHAGLEAERLYRRLYPVARKLMQFRFPHDSPFTDLSTFQLKLRLDEDDHLAILIQQPRQCGKNHCD